MERSTQFVEHRHQGALLDSVRAASRFNEDYVEASKSHCRGRRGWAAIKSDMYFAA